MANRNIGYRNLTLFSIIVLSNAKWFQIKSTILVSNRFYSQNQPNNTAFEDNIHKNGSCISYIIGSKNFDQKLKGFYLKRQVPKLK